MKIEEETIAKVHFDTGVWRFFLPPIDADTDLLKIRRWAVLSDPSGKGIPRTLEICSLRSLTKVPLDCTWPAKLLRTYRKTPR